MPDSTVLFPRPCSRLWETMEVEGHARRCGHCDTPVHDLSVYSAEEVLELIRENPHVCGMAQLSASGEILNRAGRSGLLLFAAVALPTVLMSLEAVAGQASSSGAISGAIFDSPQKPVSNAPGGSVGAPVRVTIVTGEVKKTVISDEKGSYRFDKIAPGNYRLEFSTADAFSWAIDNVLVCANHVTLRDSRSPRTVNMVMGSMVPPPIGHQSDLTVRLTTVDGQPVAGARLTARRYDDHSQFTGTTEPSGVFSFGSVRPGDISLEISAVGFEPRTLERLAIEPGEHHYIDQQVCAR